jgi:uncharacterized membrane protein
MEVVQIKKAWKAVKYHAKIAWRGFCRTLYGAMIATLMAMAVYGFVALTSETGWVAVWDFVASCATLLVALSNMYFIGTNKKGGKHG